MDEKTLPIYEIREKFLDALKEDGQCVLVAPTGSGKSTQAPQFLLDDELDSGRLIIVLEPRRIAARTLGSRVAEERNTKVGREVGYSIRFENRMSGGTRIVYVTEGVFLRWLQEDGFLEEVEAVFFDEFHERNLLSDVGLGLLKSLREKCERKPHLIVMSATIEAEPVAAFLSGDRECPIIESDGQMYPVEVSYSEHKDRRDLIERAVSAVANVIQTGNEGDVLVFMPGMGEIMATVNNLKRVSLGESLEVLPLHGDLAIDQQARAFGKSRQRKVVVATNVAETSVTIPGVRHVVDGGLARVARYDASRGINTLLVEEISRASADQRKGRAGRIASGTCQRLWSESNQLNRPEKNTPEVKRADLAESILFLHSLGVTDAQRFEWLDKPETEAITRAERLLGDLGALKECDGGQELTEVGRKMLRLPMHPRYARMILQGVEEDCVPEAALCAALVSGRDILMRVGRDDRRMKDVRDDLIEGTISDFQVMMRAFLWVRNQRFNIEACRQVGVHGQTARGVEKTFQQLLQICIREGLTEEEGMKIDANRSDAICKAALVGFVDQLGVRKDVGTLECRVSGGRTGTLVRESALAVEGAPTMFVVGDMREIDSRKRNNLTLISHASGVRSEWLDDLFPTQVKKQLVHEYDSHHKRVQAWNVVELAGFELERNKTAELDEVEAGLCIARTFLKGEIHLPEWNHEVQQLVGRCRLMAALDDELGFPYFDDAQTVALIGKELKGISVLKRAQEIPFLKAVKMFIGKDLMEFLDAVVPKTIVIGELGKRKLLYPTNQEEDGVLKGPEVQIKINECFPLQSHPTVGEGRVPIILQLQRPTGKRLVETTDWPEFRIKEYPKYKRELVKKFNAIVWP